jgi:hypothetical protein
MKRHLPLFLILLFFLPSLACQAVNRTSANGSGNIITKTVEVRSFDSVTLEASGDVYIEQGKTESLTIEADDNIMPLLDTRVKGNELVLGMKPNSDINPSQTIVYRLTVKDLNSISIKGSGDFFVEPIESKALTVSVFGSGDVEVKSLMADDLSISLFGSGNITLDDIDVETVHTSLPGSGDITVAGKASVQTVSVSGSGNYRAGDLETDTADIRIPGSADVTVWVKDMLDVNINGSGNIRYYGEPNIDQSGGGSGNLTSLGEK